MLTVAKYQFTQAQDSFAPHSYMWLACSIHTSGGERLKQLAIYKGGKKPVQELDGQRGEGTYFSKGAYFQGGYSTGKPNSVLTCFFYSSN